MKRAVIVGGGIAGLYGSLVLSKKWDEVVLIEQANQVGGLLNSFQNEHGDWFDYGTHFIAGTGVPEIDNEILHPSWKKGLWEYPNEMAGNYFGGKLSENCLFIDCRHLPSEEYLKGIEEFINILHYPGPYQNCDEQLRATFGAGLTHSLFEPVLKKLFGVQSLKELVVDAHLRFGLKRLKAFSPEATRELKKVPAYDDRLCFHRFDEGAAARPQYYPKTGGAGEWIRYFEEQMKKSGVNVVTQRSVKEVRLENRNIQEITLDNGEKIEADLVVWTVPTVFFLRAANLNFPSSKPQMQKTTLFHFVFSEAPQTTVHFYFCYDPHQTPLRVTLYSNLQPDVTAQTGRHRVTVEVLSRENLDEVSMTKKIFQELIQMGTFPEKTQILYSKMVPVPQGFPVLTHEFQESGKMQSQIALESADNIVLLGKNASKSWFMHEVFREVYQELSRRFP